jgi:ABC-type uncharacterized transport system permease subunit
MNETSHASALDAWFLGGAILFALTSVAYLFDYRKSEPSKLPQRSLEITVIFWGLLLTCWLIQAGVSGASRLWFGSSALILSALYRASQSRYRLESLGGSIIALCSLLAIFSYQLSPHAIAGSSVHDSSTGGLSWALIAHIACAIAGLTAFAIFAAMSGLYFVVERKLKSKHVILGASKLPSLSTLDSLNLNGLVIGFPLYTAALLLGSASAFQGEGELRLSYLVALGSWLIYGGVLQARLTAGWRGRRAAFLTLIAFLGLLLVAARYSFRS